MGGEQGLCHKPHPFNSYKERSFGWGIALNLASRKGGSDVSQHLFQRDGGSTINQLSGSVL